MVFSAPSRLCVRFESADQEKRGKPEAKTRAEGSDEDDGGSEGEDGGEKRAESGLRIAEVKRRKEREDDGDGEGDECTLR